MSITRRSFVQATGIMGLSGLVPAVFSMTGLASANPQPDLVLSPDEGEVYLIGPRRSRVLFKVDKRNAGVDSFSLLTEDIVPGDGIPIHKHAAEEELIYIGEGQGVFTFGEIEHAVVAGSMALVPRGTWHGLRNTGDATLRMVFGYSPAGFEDYFRAIGVREGEAAKSLTQEDWTRIDAEYGITYR